MSDFQFLLYSRRDNIDNLKQAKSCISKLNCKIKKKKYDEEVREEVLEGGRELLKRAFDNFPVSMFANKLY